MHRRGIDRGDESRALDQRREGEQIQLAREIDEWLACVRFDLGDVRLFQRRSASSHDASQSLLGSQ